MWENNDKNHFTNYTKKNLGQICNDSFSFEIESIASNDEYKTFLEIGTWNGLGSTKSFSNGFKKRKNDDFIFYSLECNKDKYNFAKQLYLNEKNINILNEVIFNNTPDNFYDIFPECLNNNLFKRWNEVDIINMKKCNLFLNRNDLPDIFDVILLDGGEFTTYFEYQILKNKCKILMLDDINTSKCKLIVSEIKKNNNKWRVIKEENLRNGYLIAERI